MPEHLYKINFAQDKIAFLDGYQMLFENILGAHEMKDRSIHYWQRIRCCSLLYLVIGAVGGAMGSQAGSSTKFHWPYACVMLDIAYL